MISIVPRFSSFFRHRPPLLVFLLAVGIAGSGSTLQGQSVPQLKSELRPSVLPPLPGDTRSGLIGASGGSLLVSGMSSGAAPGSPLTVYTIPSAHQPGVEWTKTSVSLPAWAASAEWNDAVICVGGLVNGQPTAHVQILSVRNSSVVVSDLAPLPKPLAGAAAAIVGTTLYVSGGASSLQPPQVEKTLWALDLQAAGAGWKELEPMPGAAKAFCSGASQYGMFCVFGGLEGVNPPVAGTTFHASSETWAYLPVPLEASRESGWRRLTDLPAPSARAAAVPIGQANIMLIGGESGTAAGGLTDASLGLAGTGNPVMLHLLTQSWVAFDHPLKVAAPLAWSMGTVILVVGGTGKDGKPAPSSEIISFPRTVRSLTVPDYIVIALYFIAMGWIGASFSKKQTSSAEFSLGNREVVWWAAGISMFATAASAISLMAVPALAFATNCIWLFPVIMLIPSYYITGYLMYPLLRRMNLTSTYEYLDRRFNLTLRLIASAQCILFQVFGRAAVVLVLPSIAISAITGISVYKSVFVMGALTTVYTALGGFEAVVWTAVFQGILKFLTPLFVIWICITNLPGGWHDFVNIGMTYHKFDFALTTWDVTVPAFWILIVNSLLVTSVQQAGDQPIIQRIFSSPLKEVRRVNIMSTTCGILIALSTTLMGLCIFAYFHTHPEKFDPTAQNDQIVPLFLTQAMPSGLAGMVIAAIFASAMATVATSMNSVATLFTEDFYSRIRPDAPDKRRLFVLKTSSYVAGIVSTATALLMAGQGLKSMMVTWNQISALLGGGIVGVYTLGMFTRRTNGFGAVCGAVTSILVTAAVKLWTPLHWSTYTPIAIISCMISGYLFSIFSTQKRDLAGLTIFTAKGTSEPVTTSS